MPRIAAPNIAEHVRLQEERILEAANRLFRQQGYSKTDPAEIAAEIGLARSSLYRYYPNKDHILLALIRRDMQPVLQRHRDLAVSAATAEQSISQWIDIQFETATGPGHVTLQMAAEIRDTAPELRQEILAMHRVPSELLRESVAALLGDSKRDVSLVIRMVGSLVNAATGHVLGGADESLVRAELDAAVWLIINGATN